TGRHQRLRDLSRALPRPDALLGERRQRLDNVADRLPLALTGLLQRRRLALASGPAGRFRPQQLQNGLATARTRVETAAAGLPRGLVRQTERARDRLGAITLRPTALVRAQRDGAQNLRRLGRDLGRAATQALNTHRQALAGLNRMLQSMGYTETLRRGYAVVRALPEGQLVSSRKTATKSATLEIEFADGRLKVGEPVKPARAKKKPSTEGGPQGSLF
ncbi:MAG: exodeoxyribonuclease VII large subunit, partial [Pseudomonadota bacterium]